MKALKKKPVQIYLEPAQDHALEAYSKRKDLSKAEVIRVSIDRFLKQLPPEEDPVMSLVGIGSSGKSHLAEKHDVILAKHTSRRAT